MTTPANSTAPISPEDSSLTWSGGIIRWWKNINDWIKGLSPAGSASFETKFVAVASTPLILWRRWGKVVEIRVALDGSYPPGFTKIADAAIPTSVLATGTNRRGAAWLGGSNNGHLYVGSTDGSIYVLNPTAVTVSTVQGNIIYTID